MSFNYLKIKPSLVFINVLLLSFFSHSLVLAQAVKKDNVVCTMDAMLCPDGSYVGRTGPSCEFICPNPTTNATTTTEIKTATTTPTETNPETTKTESTNPKETITLDHQIALSEADQKRIINLSANISNRLDAVVARLFNITDRISNRIILLKQQSLSTEEAENELRLASAKLANAKNLLSDIDTLVYDAVTSEQPYTSWQKVKARYQEIASLIKEAYSALNQTLILLKEAPPITQTTATSSPDINPTSANE